MEGFQSWGDVAAKFTTKSVGLLRLQLAERREIFVV